MARYIYPTAEEQIDKHLGGVLISDEVREELRCSLRPVGIMVKGGQTYYSCCQDYADTVGYNHREYGKCPICGRVAYHIKQCYIRADERQEQYHFLYRRSQAEPDTILIIGVWVAQVWIDAKYSDPETIPLICKPHSLIVIPYGGKPARYVYDRGWYSQGGRWNRREKITGGCYTSWSGGGIEQINHTVERTAAIAGTRFEKMVRWFEHQGGIRFTCDYAGILADIATYPQMEYLAARGLGGLVEDKMNHIGCNGAVNWRAKTIGKMLPLTRDELGRIKAKGYDIHMAHVMLIRRAREMGQTIKLEDAMETMNKLGCASSTIIQKAVMAWGARYGVAQIARYLAKSGIRQWDISMWLDYMEELRLLGGLDDLNQVFPKNLRDAHAAASARIKLARSKVDQKTLEERLPKLQEKYSFEAGGIRMEPFATLDEVIKEGQKLSICIGSYAERYAKGGTILCKIRRTASPETPWHAVEFDTKGRLVQCRGYKNQTWAEDEAEIRAFWKAWDRAHKSKTNVYITINHRQKTA